MFCNGFIHIEFLKTFVSKFTFGVEIALHNVVFFVHFWQSAFWLDKDETVHSVGNVHSYRSCGTMVNIKSGIQCFKIENFFRSGATKVASAPPPGPLTAWRSML
jgi:hypothetical protein